MKRKIVIIQFSAALIMLFLVTCLTTYGQSPATFNYQAVLRDASGNIRVDAGVEITLVLHQGSSTGSVVYEETHSTTTSSLGLVNLEVGSGDPVSFSSIDWSGGPYFLEVRVDGTSMGTSQLLSVPYALYAASSEFPSDAFTGWDQDESDDFDGQYSSLSGAPTNVSSFTNDAGYLTSEEDGSTTNEIQSLSLSGSSLSISDGNAVDLGGLGNRTIVLPAQALGRLPTSTIITDHMRGLLWQQNYSNSASVIIHKPSNYSGGEVEFSIFFQTTTSTLGVVDFFIRPRSVSHGDGFYDAGSIDSKGIKVTGTAGFGTMYEQVFQIPASRLEKDWWIITIQREGSESTYTDDVVVMSVALTY